MVSYSVSNELFLLLCNRNSYGLGYRFAASPYYSFIFGIGVFVGLPIQAKQSWIKDSLFKSGTGSGVFIPDWFASNGKGGYLGAIIVTALFAGIVVVISYMYESKRKKQNKYSGVGSEKDQGAVKELDTHNYKFLVQQLIKNFC